MLETRQQRRARNKFERRRVRCFAYWYCSFEPKEKNGRARRHSRVSADARRLDLRPSPGRPAAAARPPAVSPPAPPLPRPARPASLDVLLGGA